ncbi:MAG TPA: proline racemase family protein [Vicinamibacterales bacterium]|nr:proline racemase family protein [Vicinamibacterales bacterium]
MNHEPGGTEDSSVRLVRTIDAHTAGEPLRLIVDGFPRVEGRTMLERREWVREHCDHLRTALMLEPRGHADMYGALLTGPERADSDAGVLFMHNEGYSTMCGHGIIAVVTIALERGLLTGRRDRREIILDTPAGPIRAVPEIREIDGRARVASVRFRNVPSFVLHAGLEVRVSGRSLRADVAYGGAFYAIVDAEAAGIPLVGRRLDDLKRAGMEIKHAVESAVRVVHPEQPALSGLYGTIFTAPSHSEAADLRNVTIFADAEVDRSPCGTGTCAVMAVLAAIGLLGPEQAFRHESLIGSRFHGRVVGETLVGDLPAIVPEIEGDAWITGDHVFVIDGRDPLGAGFRL